ncbi:MAG: hypothetical protein ABSG71_06745 [Thermodesulfobacteriota bacterium]
MTTRLFWVLWCLCFHQRTWYLGPALSSSLDLQSFHRILGGQRAAALKVGLLGAYLGRGLMLVMANFVIHNHYLKILGAAYLIKLAFENLGESESGEEDQVRTKKVEGKGFWSVVIAVELADLAFSLDNVVAVVALSDNLYIVMFGVFIGILTMRFAAGIFTWMILREPILKPAAYLVVFNIGTELLLDEFLGIEFGAGLKFHDLCRYPDPVRGLCSPQAAACLSAHLQLGGHGHGQYQRAS